MNHTSDQHPWFIESRSSRDNPKADWYVWNDDDQRWPEARVVFVDVETSNWTWDTERQQYYWHRFYSHQPDLNYENPDVVQAMFGVVRFWLDLGLDGFRLDAVPYLFQRDGTTGENLPETHALLRQLRKEVDAAHPNRVLLAEANQWPADLVDYFGDGDECHMCFHFPLMPRLFMAVRREQRFPVTEILAQTPEIPDGCQWAIFLRNHDELTLEKVTEEERDYMVAEYVKDPRMRRHMGIGRRLAPLLDGDRRLAELLHAVLFSLPGSPVIYYGDEVLMGDNVYLGDRDSVRTPMQWSPDRNGGFSRADFAQLYLPPLMDPVYGFEAVNVEAHRRNPSSHLHWLQNMLQTRKQFPVFGTGAFDLVPCPNPSILAYVRSPQGDDGGDSARGRRAGRVGKGTGRVGRGVGTRHGTGRTRRARRCNQFQSRAVRAQFESLRPARRAGFGQVGAALSRGAAGADTVPARGQRQLQRDPGPLRLLLVRVVGSAPRARQQRGRRAPMTPSETEVRAVSAATRAALPELVAAFLTRRSATPAPGADDVHVLDAEVVVPGRPGVIDVVARLGGLEGHLVHVPLGLRASLDEVRFLPDGDEPVLGTVADDDGPALVFEATRDPELSAMLVERVSGESVDAALVRPLHEDRGSITLAMEDRLAFTAFHDVVDGPRPEIELLLALDDAGFNHLAAPLAVWRRDGRDLGLAQECLAGASSGHALALTSVRDLYASGGPPELAGGDFGAEAHRLGTMAARMHLALDKAFGRRPGHVGGWAEEVEAVLAPRQPHVLERPDVEELLGQLRALQVPAQAIRTHGDFHLGRTCRTEQGWYVVDFANGGRPLTLAGVVPERGAPAALAPLAFRSPLADVADMLCSLARRGQERRR